MTQWQEDEDDLDETEDPDESDQDSDEEPTQTVSCPRCGQEIYEETDRCPHCGNYVTPAATSARRSPWFVIGAILALLGVLMWLII